MCTSRDLVKQTMAFLQHIHLLEREAAIFMLFVVEREILSRCKKWKKAGCSIVSHYSQEKQG